jgi:hypothetical protein
MPRERHFPPGRVWRITHHGRNLYERDPQRNTIVQSYRMPGPRLKVPWRFATLSGDCHPK